MADQNKSMTKGDVKSTRPPLPPFTRETAEFEEDGLMRLRLASINDLPIKESDRKYHWPLGRRPDEHPGLSELGF